MPTTTAPNLDALISNCSLKTARRCFQKLGAFQRLEDDLENPDPDRFTGFARFGQLPLDGDSPPVLKNPASRGNDASSAVQVIK